MDRVNQQARLIGELQSQSLQGSATRIPSNQSSHLGHHQEERHKMIKTPDLPIFSGELPTPKGEVEFDNWIFQIKALQKTFMDDTIRNMVVTNARGIAKTVVCTVGYDMELSLMISHLEDRFGLGETNDTLLLEFHQMSQGVHEKVQDFGSKLECKFKILQEQFPGRYAAVQLKDRFFSEIQDKMRDSMRFLYTQEDCTFSKLLKAVMITKAESKPRVTAKVKAATADTNTNNNNQELSSIQSQLDSMSKILKSAQFNKNAKSSGKGGAKKGNNSKSAEAKPQHKSKGPAVSAAGPFTGGSPQFSATGVWDGATLCTTAQTGKTFKVVLNRETCMGRWLWRVHPFPRQRSTPKANNNFQSHGGRVSGVNTVPGPHYHNPDLLVRLIGTPNESWVEVKGVPITALIDSGANLSTITKSFAEELQLEIKGLQTILDIKPTSGGQVPYHRYVECKLRIPQIRKFDLVLCSYKLLKSSLF